MGQQVSNTDSETFGKVASWVFVYRGKINFILTKTLPARSRKVKNLDRLFLCAVQMKPLKIMVYCGSSIFSILPVTK